MNEVDVRILRARTDEDYRSVVELPDLRHDAPAMAPPELMRTANRYGGAVLIATNRQDQALGVSVAILCRESDGAPFWWSYAMAVEDTPTGREVAFQLKLAERREALGHGIGEIRWTFDPFDVPAAHLSLGKLGAVGAGLEGGLTNREADPGAASPDRIQARWQLDSPGVGDRLGSGAGVILRDLDAMVRVLEAGGGGPANLKLELNDTLLVLEVPADFSTTREADRKLARAWFGAFHTAADHYFRRGYTMTDCVRVEGNRPEALYILERRQ